MELGMIPLNVNTLSAIAEKRSSKLYLSLFIICVNIPETYSLFRSIIFLLFQVNSPSLTQAEYYDKEILWENKAAENPDQ